MTPAPNRRAILHFGPPKTATSALQAWCHGNRDALEQAGIHYGKVETPHDPKHQWVLQALHKGHFDKLEAEIAAFRDSPAQTLILSCEGVMVHRMTVPPAHWQRFRTLMSGIDRTLFLVQRDPESWLASLWKQSIINPVQPGGRLSTLAPEALPQMLGVKLMLDLPALARMMQQETGADRAVIAPLPQMLDDFRKLLDLPPDAPVRDLPRANEAIPDSFISVYRQLAERADDVPTLRLAFFGLFVETHPTNNIMLANVARRFGKLSDDQRRAALDVLMSAMRATSFADPADAALADGISRAALA